MIEVKTLPFPINDYVDEDAILRGSPWKEKEIEIDQNYILIEKKLKEIKDILVLCNPKQQANFASRLTEWVFFNTEITGI